MSSARQKGRADAAAGKYKPPGHSFFGNAQKFREELKQKEVYREGYHDKKSEMKNRR